MMAWNAMIETKYDCASIFLHIHQVHVMQGKIDWNHGKLNESHGKFSENCGKSVKSSSKSMNAMEKNNYNHEKSMNGANGIFEL